MKTVLVIVFLFIFYTFSEGQCPPSVLLYKNELVMREFITGNFTNSGMKEIVAFYQKKTSLLIEDKENYFIQKTYCFLLDKNDLIVKTIPLPFTSIYNVKNFNLRNMPLNKLGALFQLGSFGDFNNNGTEELYLYTLTGYGFYPVFLEFSSRQFNSILPYESLSVSFELIDVDTEKKKIDFLGTGGEKEEKISFTWDKKLSIFVKNK